MDYKRRLTNTDKAIESELYRQAVETASGAVENLLKELVDELRQAMPQRDAERFDSLLEQAGSGKGKRRKMTFGNWVYFYQDHDVFSLLKRFLNYELRYFNDGTLRTILNTRNECAHKDYQPTRAEAELVRNNLVVFLEETNRALAEVDTPLPEPQPERGRGQLPPWTQTVVPHEDIRNRRFDMGVFAIQLGEAVLPGGQREYSDPHTFFDLTYFTRGLRDQAIGMLRRLSGDPKASSVVHLHTTFGGGKTHTMLAQYHLAKNSQKIRDRDDIRQLMVEARIEELPKAEVAVIDGDMLTPSDPRVSEDGITLHTLWGEIAYQLGGAELYELMRKSDESRSAPGQRLLQDMLEYTGPSLILIDELLNYVTKTTSVKVGRGYLVDQINTFLKALTQAVDRQLGSMLVITMTSNPQERYGQKADEAYEELQQHQTLTRILGRIERTEVTAESDEIYEILRCRLFESIGPPGIREQVAGDYWHFYRDNHDVFPEDTQDPSYRDAIEAAYPFHPDLVDVLRSRWGTISGFQKTRGVLRLLALVVSNLYRKNHGAPLIQIGHIDLGDPEIRQQFLKHTGSPHRYDAVVGSDIAGQPDSRAENVDKRLSRNFYKYGLCEGIATSIFMYSHSGRVGGNTGGTQPQLWLGLLQPGLEPANAADAFDRFRRVSWYLEQDGALFRLGIDPNLNMMVAQHVEAARQNERAINDIIYRMIETMDGSRFGKAIIWPSDPRQVKESDRLKLVIGPLHTPWIETDDDFAARKYVDDILNSVGSTHRQFRNTVVFLMPTPEGVENIKKAAVRLLALEEIGRLAGEKLKERQRAEFQRQLESAKGGLPAAIWGSYLVTVAPAHDGVWVQWDNDLRYDRDDSLSLRALRILEDAERLLEQFDPDLLLMRGNERFAMLWPNDQEFINVSQLWDYFARYTYLPMLAGPAVLQHTIAWGVERGLFAYCLGDPETEFDTILVDERIATEQCVISKHAWLLDAEIARRLVAPPDVVPPVVIPPIDPVVDPDPPPLPIVTGYTRLHVETELDVLNWRQFHNSVIQPLIDAGATLDIAINLSATHDKGLDPNLFDLRVRESIMQLDPDAHIEVESSDS